MNDKKLIEWIIKKNHKIYYFLIIINQLYGKKLTLNVKGIINCARYTKKYISITET